MPSMPSMRPGRRSSESRRSFLALEVRCNELAKAAFDEPLALKAGSETTQQKGGPLFSPSGPSASFGLKEMVRISFVVGGGKLVRQKYSDDLPKHFCSALTLVGFQEERQEAPRMRKRTL